MVKKNKYNNKIIQSKDGKFDSKKEFAYWNRLKRLQELGKISNLKKQVKFELIPTQFDYITNEQGKRKKVVIERKCEYIADFTYTDNETNKFIVADCKSSATMTGEYIIKRKLLLYVYGIKIKELF